MTITNALQRSDAALARGRLLRERAEALQAERARQAARDTARAILNARENGYTFTDVKPLDFND